MEFVDILSFRNGNKGLCRRIMTDELKKPKKGLENTERKPQKRSTKKQQMRAVEPALKGRRRAAAVQSENCKKRSARARRLALTNKGWRSHYGADDVVSIPVIVGRTLGKLFSALRTEGVKR